ncbi:MAG: hypothetical protein U1E29_04075 [Coriobacteriia bacterium]|nr:hypothetical protein [Coriobacteriia bacterium]
MSDQDFFFDEDETSAETNAGASTAKRETEASKPAARVASPAAAIQSVSMMVAVLIGVVALLAGVIIGILIPSGTPNVPAPNTIGGGAAAPAPQLSPEQLQGGDLPPGHPPLDSMGDGAAPEGMPGGIPGESETTTGTE